MMTWDLEGNIYRNNFNNEVDDGNILPITEGFGVVLLISLKRVKLWSVTLT